MKRLIIAFFCTASTMLSALPAGHTQSQYLCSIESGSDVQELQLNFIHGCFGTNYKATFINEGTRVEESCQVRGHEMNMVQLRCGSTMVNFNPSTLTGTVSFFPDEAQSMTCMTMNNVD
jgi:hypothetical protein